MDQWWVIAKSPTNTYFSTLIPSEIDKQHLDFLLPSMVYDVLDYAKDDPAKSSLIWRGEIKNALVPA